MKKSVMNKMRANLDKALEPPRAPKSDNSESIAQRYAPIEPGDFMSPHDIKSPGDIKSPPVKEEPTPMPVSSPDIMTPHDLKSLAPDQWTPYPNGISDVLNATLETTDQSVLSRLYRLTWGFHKDTCHVSNAKIATACNMSVRAVQRSTKRLAARGLIEIVGWDVNNPNNNARGITYKMLLPRAIKSPHDLKSPPDIKSPNKIKALKESTQTQEEPAAGVGVGSKFSIEECRRYADHLRASGQGITNPGGYATTIHRTGKADALIEAYLNPAPTAPSVDASACPDCNGTGFYYPNGREQGVAKCPHSQLVS